MTEILTLIADHEAPARERLRALLSEEDDVTVIGESSHGADALEAIHSLRPDLVFLEVQLPELSGFEVVAQIGPGDVPAIVFVASNDTFALKAFDANAADYVVKPIEPERLRAALARARKWLRARNEHSAPPPLPSANGRAAAAGRERIAVRVGRRLEIVRTADVLWVEGANNAVRLHTRKGSHLYRARMSEISTILNPERFLRIHRSFIINVDEVSYIEPWGLGEFLFVLSDNTQLTSSRGYRDAIRQMFNC